MNKTVYCFFALLCVTQFACNDTSPTGSTAQYLMSSFEYSLSDNTITLTVNQSFCEDSILKHVDAMQLHFTVSHDTLFLKPTDTFSELFSDSSILVLKRIGSGSGLQGAWMVVGDKANETSQVAPVMIPNYDLTIKFTETTMQTFANQSPVDQLYYAYQNFENFNISVSKKDNSIILTGNITREKITITIVGNAEQIVYNSSDISKEDHIYYSNPTECPNEVSPDWFIDFVIDNAGLSKHMSSSSIRLKVTGIVTILNLHCNYF